MILSLLFPRKCVLCRTLLERTELDVCTKCRIDGPAYTKAKEKLPFLDSFTALWYYEGNVRGSILRYKFYGSRSYGASYGRLLGMKLLQQDIDRFDAVTWVPISRRRRFRRGYDQAYLLARALSRELGCPCLSTLAKLRHNPRQSGIPDQAQRRANVLGAYRAKDPAGLQGKRLLLVDDVLTTGATAGECARTLLTAGAKEVHCAVVAAARK